MDRRKHSDVYRRSVSLGLYLFAEQLLYLIILYSALPALIDSDEVCIWFDVIVFNSYNDFVNLSGNNDNEVRAKQNGMKVIAVQNIFRSP